jgi:SecD/SecF fusion protein
MQKPKRWHLFLILAVIFLTIYNILPTVFYYSKPLSKEVAPKQAEKISKSIAKRVNSLENESVKWLHSYCKLLKIKPLSIKVVNNTPDQININFTKVADAAKIRKYIPRAGALIPFMPAQLSLSPRDNSSNKEVIIQRQIPIRFNENELKNYFQYTTKITKDNKLAPFYQEILFDRVTQMALAIGGVSENSIFVSSIIEDQNNQASNDLIYTLANEINEFHGIFKNQNSILNRYYASFSQILINNKQGSINSLISEFSKARDQIKVEKINIAEEEKKAKEQESFIENNTWQRKELLDKKEIALITAENILKNNVSKFANGQIPWEYKSTISALNEEYRKESSNDSVLSLDVDNKNTFIKEITIDWMNDKVSFFMHDDVLNYLSKTSAENKHLVEQMIINEIAKISKKTEEKISVQGQAYVVNLNALTNSKSVLTLKLTEIAKVQANQIKTTLEKDWNPSHPEMQKDNFPIYDYETYLSLPSSQKQLCLVIFIPAIHSSVAPVGMHDNSIYVIAKGLERIMQKYQTHSNSEMGQTLLDDFKNLNALLRQYGFLGFSGSSLKLQSEFSNDFIFENSNYYQSILKASRENFQTNGSKKFATLEFTNLEQRILTENQIDNSIQEDLLKWKDDYNTQKVSLNSENKFDVPAPTKNPLLSNLLLSSKKYFRGDDRKILHWGLDLSGGKTVQIELRDKSNKIVSNEADLKQGVNELYNRVNKMGVSEVTIRTQGSNIVLDFPGSQGLSASELVKASTMYFNIVNEKFTPHNRDLSDHINKFLQDIWNEALVTNRKDIDSINLIAWKHLYGDSLSGDIVKPRTEAAKILYDNGLRFSSPFDGQISSVFNDSLSKIAIFRGSDYKNWQGQTHPLIIVFNNYALEGSNLTNIRSSYDPSRGNYLSFEITGSAKNNEGMKINPREDLYAWSSKFSQEKITGTHLERYGNGQGWRMAVILNGSIISSPALRVPLRESAMIEGSFSLREINQLVSDLKAGSLTFTPKILSEKNVSPELGHQEKVKGIAATIVSLLLVVSAMVSYYRFAGIVASIAVLFNLIIMWATLQNMQATLTLAGIAGVILTVGMAVDANVLVFERIKEEFAISKRLTSALHTGYKKAFTAILDSNVTTIIAALILLHFDAGPIKGFAVTLIIGIISSMFSSLFMTRFFFSKWVQNPKHKELKMSNLIKSTTFNFLSKAKYVITFSAIIIVAGIVTFSLNPKNIFGLDFTGGFTISLEVEPIEGNNYRQLVEQALVKKGAAAQDFQTRELNPSNHLKIMLGTIMEKEGHPFYNMPIEVDNVGTYKYESNPRINWIVKALEESNIKMSPKTLKTLDSNWTAMSGQMSDSMRNNAIIGLSLALLCILIYITIRFEFKFAFSAMLCLIHDVIISLATIALLNALKLPIQIDLHTIAALMTIIGYSLNDTIIIFDRIREDLKQKRKSTYRDIVNEALNTTLSRTTITSLTTLLALTALVALGGSTIFSFALVMTIGVIFGTLSSLFIASPLMLFFHKYELKKQQKISAKQ